MELTSATLEQSPDRKGMVRLAGEVRYESSGLGRERIWFEVPDKYELSLSTSGNPWVACLAPVASFLHEDLTIHKPVDKTLLENLPEVLAIWKCWYPNLGVPKLHAEPALDSAGNRQEKTATFFSGGVDSFFTVLHFDREINPVISKKLDDLLCVWGFDIPLSKAESFERMQDSLGIAAEKLGKELVPIITNLRETRFETAPWGALSHGGALASGALALENRYAKVLISSGAGYKLLAVPWGSHPFTDPLFSTEHTRLIRYGETYKRPEKIAYIAHSDIAGGALRVCWKHGMETNCGACEKCYRTMITLDLLDARKRFSTFPWNGWSPARMKRLYVTTEIMLDYLTEIVTLANRKGKHSTARAIKVAMRRSRLRNKFRVLAAFLRKHRIVWRYADTLDRIATRGTIM